MSYDAYDAVIVGAGITGAIVAKQLTQAGKRVLMLEAGADAKLDAKSYQVYVDTYLNHPSGVPNAPFPPNPNAPSANVLDIGQPSTSSYLVAGEGNVPFLSDYTRAAGGTTLHWQGTSLRMVPNDFRMRTVYGQGIDWPIAYDDLTGAYGRAEEELGVAADVEDQGIHGIRFPKGYEYPMRKLPPSYLDQYFIRNVAGMKVSRFGVEYPVTSVSLPQARNSTPNPRFRDGKGYEPRPSVGNRDAGLRCQGNSSCTPLCPVQAKYTALKTLKAIDTDGFRIETQAVAEKLLIDPASGRIEGVQYKRYFSPSSPQAETRVARGTLYVLACNAIENARLLLSSGAANSSGEVGRNLMDHPYLYVWGLAPERVYPFRGPDASTGIESLRDGQFRSEHAAFRASFNNWGWSPLGSPAADVSALIAQGVYGAKLRTQLADTVTRQVRLGILVEQLPSASNRVRVHPAYMGPLGIHKPVVDYSIESYSLDGASFAKGVAQMVFGALGIEDHTDYKSRIGFQLLGNKGETFNVMGSGHLVGTHRMGNSRQTSVVDTTLRTWDHSNLFLVGCGNMPTIGTSNPTLTAAALTYRAADAMVKELQ